MNDIARVKEILAAISMRDQFVMSFFHWLSRPKTNLSPQQKFAADMRATLLSAAKDILSEDHDPLMRLTTFHHLLNAHDWQGIIDGRILTQSSAKAPAEVDRMRRLRQAIATITGRTGSREAASAAARRHP